MIASWSMIASCTQQLNTHMWHWLIYMYLHVFVVINKLCSNFWIIPNKRETFTQYRYNVGPPSATLAQHCTNIGWTSRVCWVVLLQNQGRSPPLWFRISEEGGRRYEFGGLAQFLLFRSKTADKRDIFSWLNQIKYIFCFISTKFHKCAECSIWTM